MQFSDNLGGYIQGIVNSWGGVGVAIFFFLSGYGNYFSIKKSYASRKIKNVFFWLFHRIVRLIVVFVFCLTVTVLVAKLIKPEMYNFQDYFYNLITLKMPGTSTWYLKIQIMLYFFITISTIWGNKKISLWVGILTAIYVFVASTLLEMPDYWWKTAMCFSAGIFISENKDCVEKWITSHKVISILAMICCSAFAYGYILLAHGYWVIPQCVAFILLSSGVCVVITCLNPCGRPFGWMRSITLELYLIHIGILAVFVYPRCSNISLIIYLLLSVTLSWLIRVLTVRLLRQ